MGKLKIGARVVDSAGDKGTIIGKRKGYRQVRYDNPEYTQDGWFTKDWFSVLGADVEEVPCESGEVAPVVFKVGDRVRLLNDNGGVARWGKKGECGTVLRVTPENTEVHAAFDESGNWYAQFHDIELIPTLRKGDRAISQNGDYVTVESDVDSAAHVWVSHGTTKWRTPVSWLTKWEPKVGDRVNWTPVRGEFDGSTVEAYDGVYDFKLRATNGNYTYVFSYELEPLPVAPQPAVMTEDVSDLWRPVVGKFGKTRDGRKVGPIEANWGDNHPFKATVDFYSPDRVSVAIWTKEGKNYEYSWLYLVSEWVEPVAVTEAAPQPKFKPGDRVRCINKQDEPFGLIGTVVSPSLLVSYDGWTEGHHGNGGKGEKDRSHWLHIDTDLEHVSSNLAIGTRATLNAPARITAIHDGKASLKLATGGSYTLPLAALTPTN